MGQAALGAAVHPGAMETLPAEARATTVTDYAELGPGDVPSGMATVGRGTSPSRHPRGLDRLLEWVGGEPVARRRQVEGEHLFAERLGQAREPGSSAAAGIATATMIDVGTVLGHVSEQVRSPCAGILQSYIQMHTERVTPPGSRSPAAQATREGREHTCQPPFRSSWRRDHRVGHGSPAEGGRTRTSPR